MRATAIAAAVLLAASPALAGWTLDTPLPQPIVNAAASSLDGLVYIAGGFDPTLPNGTNALASFYAYNPLTKKYATLASLPGPRYLPSGLVPINGILYFIGGWTQVNPALPHADLFAYSPLTGSWTAKASLSHLTGCGASGAIRGKLYVTTACNGYSGFAVNLDVYDPVANAWTALADSAHAHSAPGYGVINDKLYVAGGYDVSGAITTAAEVYDPVAGKWSAIASLPSPIASPASTVTADGRLLVMSGTNGSTNLLTSMLYDPHKNAWSVGPALPSGANGPAAALDYGIVFLLGIASATGPQTVNTRTTIVPTLP